MNPRATRNLVMALFAVCAGAVPARARAILWTHTPLVEADSKGRLHPALLLRQEGEETAREVRAEFEFAGRTLASPVLPQAIRGGDFRLEPAASFDPPEPGVRIVRYRLRWADGNGYPFSTVLAVLHRAGDPGPVPPDPAVAPLALAFAARGEGVSRTTNRAAVPMTLRASLHLPDEIRSRRPPERFDLAPGEEREIPVEAEAVGALPGSRYTAYLLVEGEAAGSPVAGSAKVEIAVLSLEESVAPWRPILYGVLVFAAIGLGVALRGRTRARGAPRAQGE